MSDNPPENPIVENVEPPEVKLTAPALFEIESSWLVVAKNRRVNRDWEALTKTAKFPIPLYLSNPQRTQRLSYKHLTL
ncbi:MULTISPECIES: hypothetical protein [Fischerella]|uniref:Uncharacterized protein n=1 Tax=Fischerella muscicola CCMEE 5323 TaxID=2019572 RepID=A0A2N6K7L4_FISMU|nr:MULTISPECIES: hypothetical protein [Fischerella]MBD2434209.1 hypothetical protein [Fischerella sp. FACHB-380]PLZ93222.1 hypothetical protein CEN44_03660 [Fischerella muscicola CCMEE 5323]